MPYEIDFLRPGEGNGDAVVVKWGQTKDSDYFLNVVDGGFTDTGQQLIDHISQHHTPNAKIANVVLTHADNDHACGLIKLLEHEKFSFTNLWMNKPWDYVDYVLDKFHGLYTREGLWKKMRDMHPYLIELEKIAAKRGIKVQTPVQGADIGPFKVLAPSTSRYIRLIPDLDKTPPSYASEQKQTGGLLGDLFKEVLERVKEKLDYETLSDNPPATSASNKTSVVQMATFGNKVVLLTGDVGPEGLTEAAEYAESYTLLTQPSLVQIPHHGSRRNVTPTALTRWLGPYPADTRRGNAIASVGENKDGYPRTKVANAFTRRGYDVYSTKKGWVSFRQDYDKRPNTSSAEVIPFSPDVEDD